MAIYNNGVLLWGNVISSLTYASPNEKSRMFHPADNVSHGICPPWTMHLLVDASLVQYVL